MGTCFTKTHHVTGRQKGYHITQQQPHQQQPSEQQSSCVFLNDPESLMSRTETMVTKSFDSMERSFSIHDGGRSVQSKYNRWIATKQKIFSQTSFMPDCRTAEVNTGK